MRVKFINEFDIVNYKKPAMFIGFPTCSFKCGNKLCQNYSLRRDADIEISCDRIVEKYINNSMTSAIVVGGLEPFDDFNDLLDLISALRKISNDDFVIYTGYNQEEILDYLEELKEYENIIIKFGRYVPDNEKHFDSILGINLASDNQYAMKIS